MSQMRTVMVTGASRGIGRASAHSLARDGHNLILTARKLGGGATFDGTTTHDPIRGAELSGSVDEVAEECRAILRSLGSKARVLPVALDLADEASVNAAAATALNEFGSIDSLVSNAIYQGPGVNDRFADISLELIRRVVECDAVAPLSLLKAFLPGMRASGRGVFIHLTSGAATLAPRRPAGEGGWGVAYAMAKGAAHRVAGVLHVEHNGEGLRAYNLNPGHVTTEVMRLRAERDGREVTGDSPEHIGDVVAWLVRGDETSVAMSGGEVVARDIAFS